jgi:2-polyprenyl-3-methyl-5-hydroxy-6-metoxy-1,4-benzoquinol methylase
MRPAIDYFSNCPICGRAELQLVYDFREFSVMKCKQCDNSWRTNMYNRDEIVQIYSNAEYERHPYFSYDLSDVLTLEKTRFKNYDRALVHIESVIGVGTLLDVGCGSGAFLSVANGRGWNVHGIELSPGLCKACESNTNANVINGSFEEVSLPNGCYDLITFWDIIEHVRDPAFCIEKAKALLRPGGLLLFCTPNEDSLLARVGWTLYRLTRSSYRYPALALHPPAHTYFFSKRSFRKLLEQRNMTVIRCTSQEAFFEHSPLANRIQKLAVALIEKIGAPFDACYEMVILARS